MTSLNFDIVGFELGYIFALQKCDFIYNVNFNVERKAGPPFVLTIIILIEQKVIINDH